MIMPGEQGSMKLILRVPMMIMVGDRFTIRTGSNTVGTGMVTETVPVEDAEDAFLDKKARKKLNLQK